MALVSKKKPILLSLRHFSKKLLNLFLFIRVSCTAFTVFFFQVEKEQEKKEENYKQKIKVNMHYTKTY